MKSSKRTLPTLAVAFAALSLAPTLAHAGRCVRAEATPRTPFSPALTVREYGTVYGDFGMTPATCSFASLGLEAYGAARLPGAHDDPNLYGLLTGGLQLRMSVPVNDRFFITGNLGLLQYREVHNATLVESALSVGPLVLGAHYVAAHGENWRVAPYVRLLVFTGTQYAVGFGIEPGVSTMVTAHNRLAFHFGLSVPMSTTQLAVGGGYAVIVRGSAEIDWRLVPGLEIGLGADVRGGIRPNRNGTDTAEVTFETISPFLGLRAFVGSSTALQLTVSALGRGEDNTLARFALGLWSAW